MLEALRRIAKRTAFFALAIWLIRVPVPCVLNPLLIHYELKAPGPRELQELAEYVEMREDVRAFVSFMVSKHRKGELDDVIRGTNEASKANRRIARTH
jgi:hypothetical protein